VLHAKALHGHTIGPVIANLEELPGIAVRRIYGDKGYCGHNYPGRFKVWISGQIRRVTQAIRREIRRRVPVEPLFGISRTTTECAATTSRAARATA
jgi:transposase, IS5 family